jgi:hypothetical protein
MAGSYFELAKRELDRLNIEIEPLQEALNRLVETRDAWATIVRNAPPEPMVEARPEIFDPMGRAANSLYAEEIVDNNHSGSHPAQERPEENEDHGWKINAVREMFRTTYPRF